MSIETQNHSITPTVAAVLAVGMDQEDSNPSTTAAAVVAVEADDLQMALNSTETALLAVQSSDMDPDSLNSAAEAEAVIPLPSPLRFVDNFGPLTKKPASKLHRRYIPLISKDDYSTYLAETLVKLYCSGGSATSNASNSGSTATSSTDINNEAKTDLLECQHGSYVCTVCNKSFTTYQALGGHKAIHRNKPIEKTSPSASAAPDNVSALYPNSRAHVCSVCRKVFTLGQALGGHKRKHYEGQIGSTLSGVGGGRDIVHDFLGQIGTTSGGGGGGNNIIHDFFGQIGTASGGGGGGNSIVHDLDLNLLPQSEPEAEEG